MHIVVVTDAWHPQVNGVVRTWTAVCKLLREWGHEVTVIHAGDAPSIPAPSEPSLRLCLRPGRQVASGLAGRTPDILHIVTEGPLGIAARHLASKRGWQYTTSFHTLFAQCLKSRWRVPEAWTWSYLRWFHKRSLRVLVPTPPIVALTAKHGMRNMKVWTRGVESNHFRPAARDALAHLPRPIFLNVGRLAKEKNLDAFLSLDLPGTKVVVGTGPEEARLRATYPEAVFLGVHTDVFLAAYYNAADVMVFPSRSDTFGLVMLEAMACGTPVAAFPCEAPTHVVRDGVSGILDNDLEEACLQALALERSNVRDYALGFDWATVARDFLSACVPCEQGLIRFGAGKPQGASTSRM